MRISFLILLTLMSITPSVYARKANAQPMLPMAINTAKNLTAAAAVVGTGLKVRNRIRTINNNSRKTSLSTTTTTTKTR